MLRKCQELLLRRSTPTAFQFRAISTEQTSPNPGNPETKDAHKAIYLHKSRGQHILTNTRVLNAIVRNAGVRPTDTVLEIGPGTGNLTVKLLESARSVVAVEIDPRMVEILRKRVRELGFEDRLTVIQQDALKTQFPQYDLCVSNIPYGISSPLIAKLFFGTNRQCFRSATLLLQKEFARRLVADPGDSDFNRLAVNVKLVATVGLVMNVSKRDFVPIPRVDSSVVCIRPRKEVPTVDLDEWWCFTLLCFNKKNKTLGAIFRQKKTIIGLMSKFHQDVGDSGEEAEERASSSTEEDNTGKDAEAVCMFREKIIGILKDGEFENKRPSKLSHDELLHLLSLFNKAGIYFNSNGNRESSKENSATVQVITVGHGDIFGHSLPTRLYNRNDPKILLTASAEQKPAVLLLQPNGLPSEALLQQKKKKKMKTQIEVEPEELH